ncbi:MAG: hypothetical protein JWO90_1167, partial [Solirubrobacterales bacterium]|nr:hypothetical protein [Solirubrobacterales bacterium]
MRRLVRALSLAAAATALTAGPALA